MFENKLKADAISESVEKILKETDTSDMVTEISDDLRNRYAVAAVKDKKETIKDYYAQKQLHHGREKSKADLDSIRKRNTGIARALKLPKELTHGDISKIKTEETEVLDEISDDLRNRYASDAIDDKQKITKEYNKERRLHGGGEKTYNLLGKIHKREQGISKALRLPEESEGLDEMKVGKKDYLDKAEKNRGMHIDKFYKHLDSGEDTSKDLHNISKRDKGITRVLQHKEELELEEKGNPDIPFVINANTSSSPALKRIKELTNNRVRHHQMEELDPSVKTTDTLKGVQSGGKDGDFKKYKIKFTPGPK